MDKVYNKLVRDNIPEIIRRNGEEPVCHVLSEEEYWDALLKKDEEELIEVKEAETKASKNGAFQKRLFLERVAPKK